MSSIYNSNLILNTSITYRNAVYQGQINPQKQTRKDFGIVYLAKTHDFICCNNWHNDNLQGECLFFNNDQQYVYGTWINNVPQGFNVFKFDEVIFMAEFYRGKLPKNTKIIIIFQKYNLAAVLIVVNQPQKPDDLELEVYSKAQVFCFEDVHKLFNQCRWPEQYFLNNQTLIKYMSSKLVQLPTKETKLSKNNPKLRLIENKYYRFGYDQGLAIVFDQDFNRVSVGYHSKAKLKSFGIVFQQKSKPLKPYNKSQQGKIIKIQPKDNLLKTALKNQILRSQNPQLSQNYKTNLLMGVNFCNKFFKNPSRLFCSYIQNIISQASIRNIIAGSLTSRRMFEESLQFSKIEERNSMSSQVMENDLKQKQMLPITHENQTKSKLDPQKLIKDRLRLEAIKKQIYGSLQKRKQIIEHRKMEQGFSGQIIHKDIVGRSDMQTPQRGTDKSRSRKRIFEQSQKNLKLLRDFTPYRTEVNLTPFKTKMKNRIFHGDQSRFTLHAQKSNYANTIELSGQMESRKRIFQSQQDEIAKKNHKNSNILNDQYRSKESRSQGKIRDARTRQPRNRRQEERQSFKLDNQHVTFEDKKSLEDSLNQKKQRQQSQSSGRMPQYVPINSAEIYDRKKSKISAGKQTKTIRNQQSMFKSQQTQSHKIESYGEQKLIPKSKYYLEERESIGPQFQGQQLNRYGLQRNQQIIRVSDKQKSQTFKSSKNRQNYDSRNVAYNDDTFKQNSLVLESQNNQFARSNKQDIEERSGRPSFKHSNQVYLQKYQHKSSQNAETQIQNKAFTRNGFQNSGNKSMPYMMPVDLNKPKKKDHSFNNSYMHKHKVKKSIQKQIEKSPDKHRCYGKNSNNPYLQVSAKYSRQPSYQNSFTKNNHQYESPNRISRNQSYHPNSIKNTRTKLF